MNKSINQLVGEITSLAILISSNTKADVFVRYHGHVNSVDIEFYPDGWKVGYKPIKADIELMVSRYRNEKKIVSDLQKIKKNLIQFGIKNKLDYSKLDFEIEEVKHYKLA